ncbi:MAG TPA: hypothetical protein VF738_01400, partial [Rhodanobacter sp.]
THRQPHHRREQQVQQQHHGEHQPRQPVAARRLAPAQLAQALGGRDVERERAVPVGAGQQRGAGCGLRAVDDGNAFAPGEWGSMDGAA